MCIIKDESVNLLNQQHSTISTDNLSTNTFLHDKNAISVPLVAHN